MEVWRVGDKVRSQFREKTTESIAIPDATINHLLEANSKVTGTGHKIRSSMILPDRTGKRQKEEEGRLPQGPLLGPKLERGWYAPEQFCVKRLMKIMTGG